MSENETARRSQRQAAESKAEISNQQSPASELNFTPRGRGEQEGLKEAPVFSRPALKQGDVRPPTDMGNAERMADRYSEFIRFCPTIGWFIWDGRRWKRDEAGQIRQIAKNTVRAIECEATGQSSYRGGDILGDHALKSESRQSLEAMIALAATEHGITVTAENFDADKMVLNALNGTIDLGTGELREHRPDDLITKIVNAPYDPEAKAPLWEAFLNRIFAGDQQIIEFVQSAVGYSLTGETIEQCLFICHGHGANGKSVFLSILGKLVGDYGQVLRSETLMVRKNRGISNDIASLRGARFAAANEINEGERLDEARVKELTGGDRLRARFLYRDEFEFSPTFKLWFAANHKPVIHGGDHAIWRRIRVIPFTVTIPEAERDPTLFDWLQEELPGILAWAVRGAVSWARDKKLDVPLEIADAAKVYREEMDPLADFLTACCETAGGTSVNASDLFKTYLRWCEKSGEGIITQTAFGLRLNERGITKKVTNHGRLYLGIQLSKENGASAVTV
jgi:putative DNA primase/helicase